MRLIYINATSNCFHPCEVESLHYNILTKKYILYYYDRSMNDYYYAYLKKVNNEFLVQEYDFVNTEDILTSIKNHILKKVDISILPPYIKSTMRPNLYGNEFLADDKGLHGEIFVKRLDYLEIESYEDALNGVKYYYFIVEEMEPYEDGFKYYCKLKIESKKRLRKNIIARHKFKNPIYEARQFDDYYYFDFKYNENIEVNDDYERNFVKKLKEIYDKRGIDINPIVLTKVSRMILESDDKLSALNEYNTLINNYINEWKNELRR